MSFRKSNRLVAALAVLSAVGLPAQATTAPQYDTFGPLSVATFGGSGIPNGFVAQRTFGIAGPEDTPTGRLGLTATARFGNPAVTNNGAGIFYASLGVDQSSPISIAGAYGRWNFDFYIDTGSETEYTYQLFMDVDPTTGEDFKSFGPNSSLLGVAQDSWNLGFDSFETFLEYTFDPTIDGEYTFLLRATNVAGEDTNTSIVVKFGQPGSVPEPGTLALAGLALVGLGAARRKRQQ